MKIFFNLSSIELQDNGYDIKLNDKFDGVLNLYIENSLQKINHKAKTKFIPIKENRYKLTCFIFEIFNNIAFAEVCGIKFIIDKENNKLKSNNYYSFEGHVGYDQWNNLCFLKEEYRKKYYDVCKIEGTINSIAYDTAPLIKIKDKQYTSIGVEPIYDHKVNSSTYHGWGVEMKFPKSCGRYLVGIDIKNEKDSYEHKM